ncbi:MAG TPA: histone deacetylase [Gemmatimonadales bacterium]
MSLHAWSSARYVIPLPEGHRFPIAKYGLLREAVLRDGLVAEERLHEPERVSVEDLLLVHTHDYVRRFIEGALTDSEVRRIGLPWSPHLVERSHRATGGTCEAAEAALELGVTVNLAGGTHHAFPGHGEGFCVFNDVAIAVRRLQRLGRIRRAAIVDLDVHQGNGTHAIFADDATVFTFSMHGERNYPYTLPRRHAGEGAGGYGGRVDADLDVALADGMGDAGYLETLATHLPAALAAARPDLVVYLAGVDPHEGDRLGRLRLTFEGLARRDAYVLETCREVGLPVVVTIGGGYGHDVRDTVRAHANTVRVAGNYQGTGCGV